MKSINRSIFGKKFARLEAVVGVESVELLTRFPNRAMELIKCHLNVILRMNNCLGHLTFSQTFA